MKSGSGEGEFVDISEELQSLMCSSFITICLYGAVTMILIRYYVVQLFKSNIIAILIISLLFLT